MLLTAIPASAGTVLAGTLAVGEAVERSCLTLPSGGRGYAERRVTTPAFGWLTVRLRAAAGDWDVGMFDVESGRRLSGASSFGSREVAQTLVGGGRELAVVACRRSGSDTAELSVDSVEIEAAEIVRPSLVAVSVANRARKAQLVALGLDLTGHGGRRFLGAVLYGPDDARRLRRAGFVYKELIPDLAAANARQRAADVRFARSVQRSSLPSGRDSYRKLEDYTSEMKELVAKNPGLVKSLTLPFKTYEGRSVEGIEITTDVDRRDGKPVFLQMGAHHAREWPSSEHALEWAYELVNGYKAGDARVRRLVAATRTIIVPVVNPDGFNTSREAGEMAGGGAGREGPDETANLAIPYEYHRKNCRVVNPDGDDPEEGDCTQQPATGLQQFGVDPNRNYGAFWGGPGAAGPGGTPPGDYAQTYRGPGPFSEPETRNIQQLVSSRQVTTLITNHTFSNLILRPPGIQSLGESPDESKGYKALSDAMAAENGYTSQFGYELYDTSGTEEDWSYWVTGGFGFTFEIGCEDKAEESQECALGHFHPSYAKVVAEYEGITQEADENGRDGHGNREAYFIAQESTADVTRHAVIAGRVPRPAVLRLAKSFRTRTSPVIQDGVEGAFIEFDERLETVFDPPGGAFSWHVNPSTRPVVARATGRPATSIESWKLTCEFPEGRVRQRARVTVARGENRRVNLEACAAAIRNDCLEVRGKAQGRTLGPARLGRSRNRQRITLRGKPLRSRRGIDSYCILGGGVLRIGYPPVRYRRGLGLSLGRRFRNRALLMLSSSPRLTVGRVRVGVSLKTLRKRVRGARRFKVGKSTWFVARVPRAQLVFRVRGGRVREVGLADRRISRTRPATRRLLRAWKL